MGVTYTCNRCGAAMPNGPQPVTITLGGYPVTLVPDGLIDASCVALIATTGSPPATANGSAVVITPASKAVPVVNNPVVGP